MPAQLTDLQVRDVFPTLRTTDVLLRPVVLKRWIDVLRFCACALAVLRRLVAVTPRASQAGAGGLLRRRAVEGQLSGAMLVRPASGTAACEGVLPPARRHLAMPTRDSQRFVCG